MPSYYYLQHLALKKRHIYMGMRHPMEQTEWHMFTLFLYEVLTEIGQFWHLASLSPLQARSQLEQVFHSI